MYITYFTAGGILWKGDTMKKKITAVLCLVFTAASFTGCSSDIFRQSFNDRMHSLMKQKSGIITDANYINYRTDLAAGNIRDGFYYNADSPVVPENRDIPAHVGKACVSFAENSRLNVHYFTDENLEFEITDTSENGIFLGPGEKIYAVPESPVSSSNGYAFSGFRIYQIDNGSRKLLSEGYDADNALVYTVPEQCGGLEIAVEPVGGYKKSFVTLSDYYVNDTFKQVEVNGIWRINGTECQAGKNETDSVGSYTVSYEYDPDKYFFVASEPTCYSQDDSHVMFSRVSATDDISEYSVEVHPFISTVLTAENNISAEVNGISAGSYIKGQDIVLDRLKFGDTIVVSSSKKDSIQYDTDVLSLVKADDTFAKYTFKVKEPSDDFTFDPSEYKYEHGKIEFKYLGNEINGKISLSAGRKIEYSAVSTDAGYWLPDGENVITVSEDPEETRKAIDSIRFYEKKLVTVNLPQPEAGGTVSYKKGERTLMSASEKMFSGTRITMKFTPWSGWTQNEVSDTFIVSDESDDQTVTFGDTDISGVFRETDEHRPRLTVFADKQVGSDFSFGIRTADISQNNLVWDRKNNTLLDTDTGTSEGITISADGVKQNKNQMIKVTVEKTDQNKNKYTDIIYLDEFPAKKTVEIYSSGEIRTSETYYTDISLKIHTVEKLVYEPKVFENAKVTLKYADTDSKMLLSPGQSTDRDRQVLVSLTPAEHYYISGTGVTNDTYQQKMKFSEFIANADKIDKSYPRKKVCTIDLKTADSYGKVVYTLNGNQVSGVTEVKEDDELIMTYTLENKEYIIYKDFLSAMHDLLSNSPYEKSETITVTSDLDGSTITREDYISVQKKEK